MWLSRVRKGGLEEGRRGGSGKSGRAPAPHREERREGLPAGAPADGRGLGVLSVDGVGVDEERRRPDGGQAERLGARGELQGVAGDVQGEGHVGEAQARARVDELQEGLGRPEGGGGGELLDARGEGEGDGEGGGVDAGHAEAADGGPARPEEGAEGVGREGAVLGVGELRGVHRLPEDLCGTGFRRGVGRPAEGEGRF